MPLRMKDSKFSDEAVLSAQARASRKSRRKHRRDREQESLTPPRHRPAASSQSVTPDDWGFDESSLPPEQAHKRTRTDDEFFESLADAEQQDQGVGYFEEELFSRQMPTYNSYYGSAAGAAAGFEKGSTGNHLAQMDEEEYAEYVRAGIWRMRHKEELERQERAAKEKKVKEEREKKENEKRNREERERIRKLEERRKQKNKEEEEGAQRRYEEGWKRLQQPAPASASSAAPTATPTDNFQPSSSSKPPTPYPLRFTDFPWPLFPPLALPPLSWPQVSDFTAPAISTFLLPDSLPSEKHKAVLRQAVLAYHPDRFERLVGRIPEEKEDVRERVRELGLRVSQVLNELMKARS
ncbi:hypothetical protein JCM11641_006800 [Rhodosporidiobolus odoratus]